MKLDWIAVDWGTSNLRAWGLDAANRVIVHASSDAGMGGLAPSDFEPALLALVGDWLDAAKMPVLACGMVGAAQGWMDAGYRAVPTGQHMAIDAVFAPCNDPRLAVRILGGLCQAKPADVMRGEETQIAGYLAGTDKFSGVICQPGTHSKWVQIMEGEVFHFATFMTGELYALLSKQSVLRHTIKDGDDAETFTVALDDALSRPERIAANLFNLRAEAVLNKLAPEVAGARLSGLLLGLELAGAKPYWLGQNVVLIADGALGQLYSQALAAVGLEATIADPTDCVLKGLIAAKTELDGNE